MSDKQKKPQNSNALGTFAAIGIGVLAAAGAYFIGRAHGEEETAHQHKHSTPTHAPRPPPSDTSDGKKQDKWSNDDEKVVRECDICMRNFEDLKTNDEEIHTTPCGHIFCKKCIDTALSKTPKCPICRSNVKSDQTLRIFL